MNRCITFLLISTLLISSVAAEDDDVDFIQSLGKNGYDWLAEEEIQKLKKSDDPVEKIRRLLILANYYESRNEFDKYEVCVEEFLAKAEGSRIPWVQRAYNKIKDEYWAKKEKILIHYVNRLEAGLNAVNRDEAEIERVRKIIHNTGEKLLNYRKTRYEKLSNAPGADDLQDNEAQGNIDKARFDLARTIFFFSFSLKEKNDTERKTMLLNTVAEHFSPLVFMYGESVIGIPYYQGMCLWEAGDFGKAADSFSLCIDFRPDRTNQGVRIFAYMRSAEVCFNLKEYSEACRHASGFLMEFPSREIRQSPKGEAIRYYLGLSLFEMSEAEFTEVKDILGFRKGRTAAYLKLLTDLYNEKGAFWRKARSAMAKIKGFRKSIIEGAEYFEKEEYSKAIMKLQTGLKSAPSDLTSRERVNELAQAWYYMGMSYYNMERFGESAICFKEGSLRFTEDMEKIQTRLKDEEKQWFEKNTDNWQTAAARFYLTEKNDIALSAYRDALEYAGKNEGGDSTFLILGVLLLGNRDYENAYAEFSRISEESPEYLKSLRLKGISCMGMYSNDKNSDHLDTASELFESYKKGMKEYPELDSSKGAARVELELLKIDYYKQKYNKAVERGEYVLKECRDEEIIKAVFGYQVNAALRYTSLSEDREGILGKEKVLMKALTYVRAMENRNLDKKTLHSAGRQLALGLTNTSLAYSRLKHEAGRKRCAETAGEILESLFSDETSDSEAVKTAEIMFSVLKDYKRSRPVLESVCERYTRKTENMFSPYKDETREKLGEAGQNLLDRRESRGKWGVFIDRMHDAESHDREYFRNTKTEFWEELPYNYESGYNLLSESVMAELGYSPQLMKQRAGLRDSDNPETVNRYWADLFAEYRDQTGRDTTLFSNLKTFLENRILVNNYTSLLAECCTEIGDLKEARRHCTELDDYYIHELSTRKSLGNIYFVSAAAGDGEEKRTFAGKARDVYSWIKRRTRSDAKGRVEHYEAVIRIAETFELIGDYEKAFSEIDMTIQHGSVPYPPGYEEKLKNIRNIYREKKEKNTVQ